MGMQRSLWSVNALSVELGRDRRTIAKALDGVPADGTVKGHPAWYLEAALDALSASGAPRRSDSPQRGLLNELFISRIESWPEITARCTGAGRCTLREFADALGSDVRTVLTWLRAGMPYVEEGDWETGKGFVLRFSWAFDWYLLAYSVAHRPGERDAGRALGLLD
jgi:hypothetical protein